MEEMKYTTSFTYREIEFLDEGNYNGYDYYIILWDTPLCVCSIDR